VILLVGLAMAADTVMIRGNVKHNGSGPVVVEALLIEPNGPPLLVGSAAVPSGRGAFELEVPARVGSLRVRAAHDVDRDGIGPGDAQAVWPELLEVVGQPIEGLELHLEDSLKPVPGTPGNP